ncbi:MAG: hypothetical protein IPO32_09495 [Crocinitomicaceae bacterium]|nr:hypothetical protein [Crocinitomicaceae bacterium]
MLKLSLAGLLTSTLLIPSVFSQENSYSLKDYDLDGPVLSMTSSSTNLEKKPEDQQAVTFSVTFNKSGYLVESVSSVAGLSQKSTIKYVYNDKNQIIEEIENDGQKSFTICKNTYDENGYITESKKFLASGAVDERIVFIYNEKMELAREEYYSDPEKNPSVITHKTIYRYNAKSLPIEIVEDWGTYNHTTKYAYNAMNQLVEEYYISTEPGVNMGIGLYTLRSYNEIKKLSEIVYKNIDGKVISRESFTYDHMEKLTHHSQLTVGGKVTSHIHYTLFDDEGNWQKATTYVGSKATAVEERVITYQE